MQQVAASNNDIAAQKLFPGDVDAEASGAGGEFAKFMIGSSEGADSAKSEQSYRGHGDLKNTAKDTHSDSEKPSLKTQESEFKLEKPGSEESIAQDGQSQDGQSEEGELHEEWVSIIQKLNGEAIKPETETDAPVVEDPSTESPVLVADTVVEDSSEKSTETPPELEPEVVTASSIQDWKQQLREKLLNSGHALNAHQMKSVDKAVNGLSDEEIQQLLNDDAALKQMMSDILKVEDPHPHDVSLLIQLSEQNNEQAEHAAGNEDILSAQDSETSGGSEQEQSLADLMNDNAAENAEQDGNTDNSEAEFVQFTDAVNETLNVEDTVNVEALSEGEALSENEAAGVAMQQDPGKSVNNTATDNTVSDTQVKPEQLILTQLLNELDNSTETTDGKIAAIDSLTRRLESSEVGQTAAGKKFIESLKNVSAEFKEQLKTGHEPGINISKIITEGMVADSASVESAALEQQVKSALQQIVNVAHASSGMDSAARETLLSSFNSSMTARDNNTAQLEAQKTQQQNLQNSAFDKAVNIQKPEAAQELANKVQVMLNQKNMVADIRLDPPDLGQMQIKISMQGDTASVSMVVQSQAAREALEHNQPRLKELLEQQGIELGQSSVREEQQGQKGEGDGQNFASGKGQEAMDDIEAESSSDTRAVGLDEPEGIDFFA